MKKLSMMLLSLILLFVFSGCSSEQDQSTTENKNTQSTETTKKTTTDTKQTATNEPTEPHKDDKCYFCNMKIYTKDEEMGASTAQAIKADGTHVFFDDSGCITNAEKKYNEKFTKKWVRDYVTKEWVETDKAVVVKADVTTPMKYNYIFFANKENANKYIKDNKTNGVITDWNPINTEAAKRYQMRMQKEAQMKNMDSKEPMDNSNNMNMQK